MMNFIFSEGRLDCRSEDGLPMGNITFPAVDERVVNIDHVFTSPVFFFFCVAEKMMDALMAHLEKEGKLARLTCPYSQHYIEKHPQWSHLVER